ncbi:MAG: class II aldolase [Rhodospirillaceae bacterium]|jgi:L-fuculose-phosphate aldolase|nr:class II aldolase [Rhodospirillaceae bacterium]MBT6089312.1 class II aldolase [Rhodospirillaceae bacterium]
MTTDREITLRVNLIQTCHAMADSGLTFGTSGNASVRMDSDSLLITPTGLAYDDLQTEDIVLLKEDGHYFGIRKPSSEWRFHRDILKMRRDVDAVVHVHSQAATALACRSEGIPSFHYMVAVAGGEDIRCAPYATFGTQNLSENALTALEDRYACLLANHGQIALGSDLAAALKMAGEVESLAGMYWQSIQGGKPTLLSKDEMQRVLKKFETYGDQNATPDDGLIRGD